MSNADRLTDLGLALPGVATPIGAYLPARRDGDLVWTSGQLPLRDGELVAAGLVGREVSVEDGKEAARVCALNAVAAAADVAGGIDELADVVKVTGFVASSPDFTGQPAVVNGASELLGELFGEAGRHARSAVGVAALPNNASVEVEVVFRVR